MLRVVGCERDVSPVVEVDRYIPLSIDLGCPDAGTPLYWRGRDGDGSLVEVGISPGGVVCSIVLTSISRARIFRSSEAMEHQFIDEGIPRVDTSPWPEERRNYSDNFVEQRVPLRLVLGQSTATLWLSEGAVPSSWQGHENVIFGISEDGMLCCIQLNGLTDEQLEVMAQAD